MEIYQINIKGVQTDDVLIGLLIRAKWMKSLEPMQVIDSETGSLYAYKIKMVYSSTNN